MLDRTLRMGKACAMASAPPAMSPGIGIDALASRLAGMIAREPREVAALAFCDGSGRLVGIRRIGGGWDDAIDLPLRRIVADVVLLDAVTVVMAHNHPSGESWPSRADRAVTLRLARALASVEARLDEHVVVGRDGAMWSFRAAGLL